MIRNNAKRVRLFPLIALAIIASSISAVDAKGGAGGGGVKAGGATAPGGLGSVPASGAPASAAGANNARGGRGIPGRNDLRGFNNGFGYGYGYGGGLGGLNQSDGMNVNPAPTGQALDAYNEKQDDRRAKLTPAATVKTYARTRAK